jgi:predicted DNA-binding ribbon-helix-helix protein
MAMKRPRPESPALCEFTGFAERGQAAQEAVDRALDAVHRLGDGCNTRSLRIGRRRTTLRLDAVTWAALDEITARERVSIHEFCAVVNREKPRALPLTLAIRRHVLRYFRDAATDEGHARAGHGNAAVH